MERSKNRIRNRNLREQTEPCSCEEFPHRERQHQHRMDTVEELIPREGFHHGGNHHPMQTEDGMQGRGFQHRAHRHPMQTEDGMQGRGFRHRARPAQQVSPSDRGMGEQNRYRFFMHPEPFTSPRDLMHEKWMLEMRIFRLKKRLHRINHRLREQFE